MRNRLGFDSACPGSPTHVSLPSWLTVPIALSFTSTIFAMVLLGNPIGGAFLLRGVALCFVSKQQRRAQQPFGCWALGQAQKRSALQRRMGRPIYPIHIRVRFDSVLRRDLSVSRENDLDPLSLTADFPVEYSWSQD